MVFQLREANEALVDQVEDLMAELRGMKDGHPGPQMGGEQLEPFAGPSSHEEERLSISIPTRPQEEPATPTTSLRRELLETRKKLEDEQSVLARERQEAERLRQELSARRDREKWKQGEGIFVKIAKFGRILQRRKPQIQNSRPLNV